MATRPFVQWYAEVTCEAGRQAEKIKFLAAGVFRPRLQQMKTLV